MADRDAEALAGTGFWGDTWRGLRRRPKFVIAAALIAFIIVVATFPALFTGADPGYADPNQSLLTPSAAHWFGTDLQGHDIYARTVYGARASITVGLGATLVVFVVGGALGALAGFYGGWIDAVVSRIADVFFGYPTVAGRDCADAGHASPHRVDGDRDPCAVRLAAGGPDRARRGARGPRQRLCAGGESAGAEQVWDTGTPRRCPTPLAR